MESDVGMGGRTGRGEGYGEEVVFAIGEFVEGVSPDEGCACGTVMVMVGSAADSWIRFVDRERLIPRFAPLLDPTDQTFHYNVVTSLQP